MTRKHIETRRGGGGPTESMAEHVRILVADAKSPGTEAVPARHLGEHQWKLRRSPLYATEVAAGDVIRIFNEETGEFEIIARGGNVCVQFYMADAEADDADATQSEVAAISAEIEPLGGRVDASTPGLIAFTVSVQVGFAAIERVSAAAMARRPGAQWQYSNVYHPTTGEPLGWWESV